MYGKLEKVKREVSMPSRRVMLKLSGEALAGEKHFGFSDDVIFAVANSGKGSRRSRGGSSHCDWRRQFHGEADSQSRWTL